MNIYSYHLRIALGKDEDDKTIYACVTRRSWATKQEATTWAMKHLKDYDVRLVIITQEGD